MQIEKSPATVLNKAFAPASSHEVTAFGSQATQTLTDEHQPEILAFLAARPLHTVIMAGHIRDNGVVSALNRGTFHAYRDPRGSLEGVALIGHATLMETRSPDALRALAQVARRSSGIHLVMAEQEELNLFWSFYAQDDQQPRLRSCISLLEQRWPVGVNPIVSGLRQATAEDLQVVMQVEAEMAQAEGGVNPLKTDIQGFRERCARRIALGRTLVCREAEDLIFKIDIISKTPEAIYLEGVWVSPRERGKNYGLRCLTQVGRTLLKQTTAICVLVNDNNACAHALYRRAGFKQRATYQSIFLHAQPEITA